MIPTTAYHFGPDPHYVGGMGSVIALLTRHSVGADAVNSMPTWRPNAQATSARLSLVAGWSVLRLAPHTVAHFHLSERGSFLREGALVRLAHLRRLPVVVTIHGAAFLPFADRWPQLAAGVLRAATLIGMPRRRRPRQGIESCSDGTRGVASESCSDGRRCTSGRRHTGARGVRWRDRETQGRRRPQRRVAGGCPHAAGSPMRNGRAAN